MISAQEPQEIVGVVPESKTVVTQKTAIPISVSASAENAPTTHTRYLQAYVHKPIQPNIVHRQDQGTTYNDLQILRAIPHSLGDIQVITPNSTTTTPCITRIPLTSPKKGAVISIPTGRIVTPGSGTAKLKVGDTVVIPAKTLNSINPEKASATEPIVFKSASGQLLFTPTKMMSSPADSTIIASPAMRSHLSQEHVLSTPESRASPARINAGTPLSWTPSPMRYKRHGEVTHQDTPDTIKRSRRTPSGQEKGNKGLRHFAMLVCEKVKQKNTTTYNEVADELVAEYSSAQSHMSDQQYDQKNIRRRVYDALNVLMAMNIIYKDKKDIHWVGLPTNSVQELQSLQTEKSRREMRIKQKTAQLHELILQQIAFKSLVQRNKQRQQLQGPPASNSAIQLPFIIVNTSKKTVIDCSISNDKYEYLFNFDNTFEIHDDIEVLKRMGMAYGLEKGSCSRENLSAARQLVPPVLQSYLEEMSGGEGTTSSDLPSSSTLVQNISCHSSIGKESISFSSGINENVPTHVKREGFSQGSTLIIDERSELATGLRQVPSIKTEMTIDHSLSPLNLNT